MRGQECAEMDLGALAKTLAEELGLMPLDPRSLRPSEFIRLLNSTPLGEVIDARRLDRQRARAGFRIGDQKTLDLLRYAAWLAVERHKWLPADPKGLTGYEAFKERMRKHAAEQSLSGRDIGELPAVVNSERKARAARDFRYFCEQYFPETFPLAWSEDHFRVIAKIERAVREGGHFAIAMPRHSGKTSLIEVAAVWAVLYGHRRFIMAIGADEGLATAILNSVKMYIETNERLAEDFPEVCYPIAKLEGIHQRAAGQLHQGAPTRIRWTDNELILPTIPGSLAAGAIVRVAGITGRIRGNKYVRPDGKNARPDLVLVDDPQTDESAASLTQCNYRMRVMNGAILGLGGPGEKIAALAAVTVIRQNDMADRLLDRQKSPHWQSERTKMVYAFPANQKIWDQYAEIVRRDMPDEERNRLAAEFYGANRAAMDEGAQVAWPANYEPGELSALQHAMNLKIRDEIAFFAEYQNEPLPETPQEEDLLTADQIAAKLNGHDRGRVPVGCNYLTMFVDVQQKALFYVVAGWAQNFTGHVVEYGTEPDQRSAYFTLREARRTLLTAKPGAGLEAAIYAGLERLMAATLDREWPCADGARLRIDRCIIDANWPQSTNVVYQFCRQSKWSAVLLPSHGKYFGASSAPFFSYKPKPGDRMGLNWRVPAAAGKRFVRHVIYDTNFWKTFVHERLRVPMGDPSCLALFGRKPETHRLFAEHLTAEFRVRRASRDRMADEWEKHPNRDNHWWDALVGAAVAASMEGAAPPGLVNEKQRAPRRSYAERYADWKRAR